MGASAIQATTTCGLQGTAKVLTDLDLLIRALLATVPAAKPWQRQLCTYLTNADGLLQVLRMSVVMDRSDAEVLQAARDLVVPLKAANAYVNAGRADAGTKKGVQLAYQLSQSTLAGIQAHTGL